MLTGFSVMLHVADSADRLFVSNWYSGQYSKPDSSHWKFSHIKTVQCFMFGVDPYVANVRSWC